MKSEESLIEELEQSSRVESEEPQVPMEETVEEEEIDSPKPGRMSRLAPWLGGAVVGGLAVVLLAFLLVGSLSHKEYAAPARTLRSEPASQTLALSSPGTMSGDQMSAPAIGGLTEVQRDALSKHQQAELASNQTTNSAPPAPGSSSSSMNESVPTPPMIVRTAQITVVAQNLDKARSDMDQIVRNFGGYLGNLSVTAPSDGPRKLTATLRIPANQLDAALSEVKKVGRVESESQNGEDVTAQYVDLEARISNARNTEQRLLDLLRQRTGKLSDVLEVETELSRMREEIERMEGERRLLAKQVSFSTITASVTEVYKAPAGPLPDSLSTRFRNAAVEGYQSVVNFIVDIALFLLANGLLLLVWAAILYYPARWIWRKTRASQQAVG